MADDNDWMQHLNDLGNEDGVLTPPRPIDFIAPELLTSWASYGVILKTKGQGFDTAYGIMTWKACLMLGMGYSIQWGLQRLVFGGLTDVWNKHADNSRDHVIAHWSGTMAHDEDKQEFFVVDWELFVPNYGYNKARVMVDPLHPTTRWGALCMDDAPFFPPWRSAE